MGTSKGGECLCLAKWRAESGTSTPIPTFPLRGGRGGRKLCEMSSLIRLDVGPFPCPGSSAYDIPQPRQAAFLSQGHHPPESPVFFFGVGVGGA